MKKPTHFLQAPVFLLWGELDPWITPASADKIQKIFPAAKRVDIRGGHCEQPRSNPCDMPKSTQ